MTTTTMTTETLSAPDPCTVCDQLPALRPQTRRLRVENLEVGYQGRAILPPLSFEVQSGEIWALFGPNGGGKSTLLRTLLGLQPAVAGRVDLCGSELSSVPQRQTMDALIPQRSIDVVRDGTLRGWSFLRPWTTQVQKDAIQQAALHTEILPLLSQPFQELSEGQKQRVLIARALAGEPALLTLDEPTSAMDPFHEEAIFRLLEKITIARDLGVIVASHHMHILTECASFAIYVDREHGVAISGPFHEVAEHPSVIARYGDLMSARPCHSLGESQRLHPLDQEGQEA